MTRMMRVLEALEANAIKMKLQSRFDGLVATCGLFTIYNFAGAHVAIEQLECKTHHRQQLEMCFLSTFRLRRCRSTQPPAEVLRPVSINLDGPINRAHEVEGRRPQHQHLPQSCSCCRATSPCLENHGIVQDLCSETSLNTDSGWLTDRWSQ